jgi:glycosyltransferase involved in cell wall biosynthesis
MPDENRLPISVCIIAGAEAARIRRTLDSITGWVKEIIVVINDNVNDGTDQIAASCGAKVFREPWKGYGAQKNSAMEKAVAEWVLGLDADEAVSPELRAEIQQLFAAPEKLQGFAAFNIPRCTFYLGRWIRHGDWYPDRIVRLWQRHRGNWTGMVHERLVVQGRIGCMKAEILHYSMESLEHQIRKTLKYADEFARIYTEQGKTATFLDVLVRPVWRFWRAYLFKLGFLDGWQGFAIAWMTAFYTFLRYARVREVQMQKPVP